VLAMEQANQYELGVGSQMVVLRHGPPRAMSSSTIFNIQKKTDCPTDGFAVIHGIQTFRTSVAMVRSRKS
jgi:hypothetical protein